MKVKTPTGHGRKIMNKKASFGIGFIVGIVILIIGFSSMNFVKDLVTDARGASSLDCSNYTVISDGTKITCLIVDLVVPYFIVILLAAIGGGIVGKII